MWKQNQDTSLAPMDGTSLSLMPSLLNLLKEATISRVAAATVKLTPDSSSIKYSDFGNTAIGHREQAELVWNGLWSDTQMRNSQVSLRTSISSPLLHQNFNGKWIWIFRWSHQVFNRKGTKIVTIKCGHPVAIECAPKRCGPLPTVTCNWVIRIFSLHMFPIHG